MTNTSLSRKREVPPAVMAVFDTLLARDQDLYGPAHTFTQVEVDAFVTLTGDKNPIHVDGARNNFTERPVVPGLMLVAMIPKLSGVDMPFVLQERNLVNMLTEAHFRYPVQVGDTVRMRFYPERHPEMSVFGPYLDVGFALVIVSNSKDAMRGKIRLGYI